LNYFQKERPWIRLGDFRVLKFCFTGGFFLSASSAHTVIDSKVSSAFVDFFKKKKKNYAIYSVA
jgi:hypothetical protein